MSDKRQAILDAAQSLLAQYGFHGFSMKQLASKAGIAAGTVYLYFQDKEAVIRELHYSVVSRLARGLEPETVADKPAKDQLRHFWMRFWAMSVENPDRILCKSQFDSLPLDSYRALVQSAQAEMQPLLQVFAQAKAQGLLKALPEDALVALWLEPCLALARKQVKGLLELNEEELELAAGAGWDAIAAH